MEFTNDFFKKEIREGFAVPEMMKRAWAAQMEVLQIVVDICNKNGLQYFADGGTLLGAVRHQGFIPWDDDIDISMKREAYNQLIRILPQELPRGFVVAGMYAQSERLQMAAYVPHLRVMADETLWDFNEYMRYFHGFPYQRVGIDIFPLDYIPREHGLADIQKLILQQGIILLRDWELLENAGELQEKIKELESLCGVKIGKGKDIKNRIWRLLDTVISMYHKEEADNITNYAEYITQPHYQLKKECYDEVKLLPFEQIEIAVPVMYDAVLTAEFGDYMTPVKGAAGHDYPFYGHMEEELKKQIKAVGFHGNVEEFCQEVSSGRLRV